MLPHIQTLCDAVLNDEHPLAELNGMLLSNLTHGEAGGKRVFGLDNGATVAQLAAMFARGPLLPGADPTAWIATILQNISSTDEGQELIMHDLIHMILPFGDHPSLVRRRGVLGLVRNVTFNPKYHLDLLRGHGCHCLDHLGLPYLLKPLRGSTVLPEDEDALLPESLQNAQCQERQPDGDSESKRLVLEALLMLAQDKATRALLRGHGTYPILREYHLVETDEQLKDAAHSVVGRTHLTLDALMLNVAEDRQLTKQRLEDL